MSKIARHPKGLYLLFATEMWERFSYYGMRAILVLYLTATYLNGGLGLSDSSASLIYGVFTGLVYFTPLIGGFIADKYIGQAKSIVIGACVMAMGEFALALGQNLTMLYTGLFLLILGNGFFKPNISVMVGELYKAGDVRRDGAFTIFYMGINIGAFFSPLVVGSVAVKYGFNYGFAIAGVGMLVGLLLYISLKGLFLAGIGNVKVDDSKSESSVKLTKDEKDRTIVIAILTFFAVIFFAGFEQAGCSMTLFTEKYIDRNIGGFEIPTGWFQSINPFFIVLLAPVMSILWQKLGKDKFSIPAKMGVGLIMLGAGFIFMLMAVMSRGGNIEDPTIKSHMLFVVAAYFMHTIGELCLSPIGLSMVSRLSPVKLASVMMGVWLASSAVANFLAGYLSAYAATHTMSSLFIMLIIAPVVLGIILLSVSRRLVFLSHGKL